MAYFFHLLHRFLSDSYMVSLCPDLLEQHSTVSQYIPTSAAHLLTEKKRDYFSSVLKNRAPCYTAHSVLIIYKAFYNKGRFYFTDLHFQTPTCSFHSSDVNFFSPSIQCQDLKLRIVISAFSISMSLRTCTLSLLQDQVCYCAQAQMSPFHSLVSIPITSVFRTRLHIHHHQSYNMSLRCSLLFSQTRTSDTLEPVSRSSVKQQSSCKCGDVSSILS